MKKILILLATLIAVSAHAQTPRNVVIIFADDISGQYVNRTLTPTLTSMTAQGRRYINGWATPKCSTSRGDLLTGYPASVHGIYDNGYAPRVPDSALLANNLPDGYVSAVTGKWNVSGFQVEDSGFDETCLWVPNSQDRSRHGMEDSRTGSRFHDPSYEINGVPQNGIGQYGPHVFRDFALDFMNRARDNNQPFVLYYPMVLGHGARGNVYPRPPGRSGKPYEANIREMDAIVALFRNWAIANGNNTLIIFATDNPTAKEGKSQPTPRGCEVPFIMWGSGVAAQGRVSAAAQIRDVWTTVTGIPRRGSINLLQRPRRPHNLSVFRNVFIIKKGNLRGSVTHRKGRPSRNIRRVTLFDKNSKPIRNRNSASYKRKAQKVIRIAATNR